MPDVEIIDIAEDADDIPTGTDEFELQEQAGGATRKATFTSLEGVVGGAVPGAYMNTKTLDDDATWTVNRFVAASGEIATGIALVSTSAPITYPTAIFFMDEHTNQEGLNPQYAPTTNWATGLTSNPDTDGKINVWMNIASTPNYLTIKNRTGNQIFLRVLIFTWSDNGIGE